jgi:hypothetical protein
VIVHEGVNKSNPNPVIVSHDHKHVTTVVISGIVLIGRLDRIAGLKTAVEVTPPHHGTAINNGNTGRNENQTTKH